MTAETAIIAWLRWQDQSAATWLVHTHRQLVLSIARRAGAPPDLEEDALQEVFLRVFRYLPRFQPRQPFAHWLSVVARNTCAKLRRRWCQRHRLSALFENGATDVFAQDFPHDRCPDKQLMHHEKLAALEAGLGHLSAREREILERHTLGQEDAATLAASMGMSPGALRVVLHRARQKLCQARADKPAGEPAPRARKPSSASKSTEFKDEIRLQ
jgi:RNA polymerase sigma-70 factor (ECF subfamily)